MLFLNGGRAHVNTPRLSDWKSFVERAADAEGFRLALIASAIVLVAASLGGAAYVWHPAGDAQQASVYEQRLSRLPRPRPDEPATTGSIDRLAAAPAPQTRASPPPAASLADSRRVEELRKNAMVLASSWADCAEGVESEVLESPAGYGERVVIRVQCGNGTRLYLDEEEIGLNRSPAPPASLARLGDSDAIAACEEKLKHGLPVPSSFSRLSSSTGVYRAPGDDAVVTFDFDAKNGLGFPLAMQVQCLFEEREIARLEVNPR